MNASRTFRALAAALLLCSACGGEDDVRVAPAPAKSAAPDPESLAPETQPFAVAEPPLPAAAPDARGPTAEAARLVYSHVKATVRGGTVTTEVIDVVVNDGAAPIDFTYRFPLPGDATVTEFAHFRDGKRIVAEAREKSAAKAGFDAAKAKGESAALAEVDGNSRFSVALSPLAPGESRRVELGYLQTLDAFGATRSYVFPAAHSERRGEPVLDFQVDLVAGARIERLESLNHPDARVVHTAETQARVLLERAGDALGQDLVLRWSEEAQPLELSLRALAGEAEEPGYGELDFAFNADPFAGQRPPRDFVFVVDTSLSMAGEALVHAKLLVERATAHLSARDRLALVTFDDALSSWDAPIPADAMAKKRALDELAPKRAAGFSNVDAAIDRAAELVRGRERPVVLFVTDGQSTVGDSLDELSPASSSKDFAGAHVFVALFNYPSRQPLLEKLFPGASLRFLPGGKAGEELVESFAQLVSAPVLENVKVTLEGLAEDRRHGKFADRLALGDRIRVLGRLTAPVFGAKVTGTLHGRPVEFEKSVGVSAREADRRMLPRAWARARIGELEARYGESREDALRKEIVDLGTRYGLVSTLTSMLAVDSLSPDRIAPGDPEIRVRAPRSLSGVRAVLPWGEHVACHFDPHEGLWLGRFLVPRATADGLYRARIFTEGQGRTALRGTLAFRVDSKAPRFRLRAERRGADIEIVAEPESDVFDHNGDSIRLDLIDVKSIVVRVGGRRAALAQSGERIWSARLPLPAVGRHDVELVAADFAQNGSSLRAELEVPASAAQPLVVANQKSSSLPVATDPERAPSASPGGAPVARIPGVECLFERSARRARVVTLAGQSVELFDGFLRVDGRMLTPCDDLPASHPTALAAFGRGFAVGFRAGGVHVAEEGRFRSLPGLPADAVTALASDGAGQLFAGTATRGLFRVTPDGVEPVGGELAGGGITALAWAGGALHVGTAPRGHVVIEEGAAPRRLAAHAAVGCFQPFTASTEKGASAVRALPPGAACLDAVTAGTLPSAHVTALAVQDGKLVVGTLSGGAFELGSDGRPRPIAGAPRFVNSLLADGGTLWFATPTGLYARRDGAVRAVPLPQHSRHVNGLARGKDGTLWLATGGGVVGLREGEWRSLDERQGLPSRIAYAVTESEDGTLWVGTAAGVARVAPDGVESFTPEDGRLPHRWVTALLADRDGALTGTYAGGVVRLGRGDSRALDAFGSLWVNPHGLFRARGRLYAASLGDGLFALDAGSGKAHAVGPLPSDDVTALAELGAWLWVGTRGGLARLPREEAIASGAPRHAVQDSSACTHVPRSARSAASCSASPAPSPAGGTAKPLTVDPAAEAAKAAAAKAAPRARTAVTSAPTST